MERIEREVIKTRGLIVNHKISNHRVHRNEKEARVLSRATERTEREIMDNLEANLSLKDGPFPRLPTMKFRHPNEHIYAFKIFHTLLKDAKRVVRSFQEAKGWATGTLDLKITTH